jgi:SAM-dependent methyltransferase
MNQEVKKFLHSLECPRLDVLEISGTRENEFNFRSYRSVNYPEYDVCERPLSSENFDLIIAEQVSEHVQRPDRAASHVFEMLKPGGIFVITTPFLLKIHHYPGDYYRWTQDGMRVLLEHAGFVVLKTGSWGNRQCLMKDLKPELGWASYIPFIHSLKNDPQLPIVIWAFAQRPLGAQLE